MGWSEKYKKSIDCDNPKGFSQRAHCQSLKKVSEAVFSHKTPHLKKSQHQLDPNLDLKQLVHHATVQYVDRDADGDVDVYDNPKKKTPDENVSSAVKAQEYSKKLMAKQKGELKHTRRGMAYEETMNEEGLRDWFGKSKSKDGKPGWVNVVTGGTCASDEPGEGTPKCVSSAKRSSMSKAERLSAARRKKAADPGQQEKSGAAKPTYVSTDPKKKMKEETDLQEVKDKSGKGSGKKDACYHKVKSRYDVWPSAYASGALVKCRKVGADNWGTKSEQIEQQRYCPRCQKNEYSYECKYGPKFWALYSTPIGLDSGAYDPNTPHPTNEEKDQEYSMARSELSTIISAAKRLKKKVGKGEGSLEAWVQSKITKAADYIDTAADYVESGEHNVDEGINIKSLEISGRRPKKITTMTKQDAERHSPEAAKLHQTARAKVSLPTITEDAVEELESGLKKLENTSYDSIDKLMRRIMKEHGMTAKELHNAFVSKHDKTPDDWIKDLNEKCWDGYKQVGMKKKGKKLVPNCVSEQYSNWREELSEDWQSVNRKDKTDGLSQKAVNAYRRENPGSKLQTAVTEKNPKGKRAKRRSSFCSRMKGMKSKLTSTKTARDPDSRINKALRRWNCN